MAKKQTKIKCQVVRNGFFLGTPGIEQELGKQVTLTESQLKSFSGKVKPVADLIALQGGRPAGPTTAKYEALVEELATADSALGLIRIELDKANGEIAELKEAAKASKPAKPAVPVKDK